MVDGWSQLRRSEPVLELANLVMQTRQGIQGWPLSSSLELPTVTHGEDGKICSEQAKIERESFKIII